MKPGVTTQHSASTSRSAFVVMRPILVILSPLTPTSARYDARPDPSTTTPFLITRSYVTAVSFEDGQIEVVEAGAGCREEPVRGARCAAPPSAPRHPRPCPPPTHTSHPS